MPAVGAAVDLWLLSDLDGTAITLGLVRLALGVVYLAVPTRGSRQAPPEVQFTDEDTWGTAVPAGR
ncbi:hypothetical protein [Geodermatophilus maliterrae]|uniref:Uncharacterized protein n=1 Tax=Geodermatophilus maliterrae TaxID=3162531 RepID=A0ABV3XIU8_9ACTN